MKMKKLLASALAATMILSSMVSSFVASAAAAGTITAGSVNKVVGNTDTVAVDVVIDLGEGVVAPHNIVKVSLDGYNLTDVTLGEVVYAEGSAAGVVTIDEKNLADGKVLIEAPVDNKAPTVKKITFTATFTDADENDTAEGTYDIVVNAEDMTNVSEAALELTAVNGALVVAHECVAGEEVTENEVAATCTTDGSYDTVTYCVTCDKELSRVTNTVKATGHAYDDGVIDPDATCDSEGVKTYTCANCGHAYTEAVSAKGHTFENGTCTVCGATDPDYVPECDHADATRTYDKNTGLYTETCDCGYTNSFAPEVAAENISIPFTATTLDLNESIGLIYYISAAKVKDADYFYLNVDHKKSDGSGDSKNNINYEGTYSSGYGGEYKFAYPDVAAKEMMDVIYATIYVVKDGYIYSTAPITFNPRDYADKQLKANVSASLKTLLVDMLNYGAEAQKQFKYNVSNPANADLDPAYVALGTSSVPSMTNSLDYGDNTQKVKHSIPTLSLNNKVEITYYVTDPTKSVEDVNNLSLVIEYNGKTSVIPWSEFEYVSSYKEYKVNFSGLAAKEMGTIANFTIYENYGTDSQNVLSSTMKYSIESYAAARKTSDGQLYNTCVAMIRYGRSAAAFFK